MVKKRLHALAKNKKVLIGVVIVVVLVLLYFNMGKLSVSQEGIVQEEETQQSKIMEETFEETEGLPTAVSTTAGCMDTDGGLNFAMQGTVSAVKIKETDTCSRSDVYKGRLYEEYCTEEGLHARYTYDCPSGVCEEGACA